MMMNNIYNKLQFIDEPSLSFAYNQKSIFQKDGLMLFGPYSYIKTNSVKTIGIIGPYFLREKAKSYIKKLHSPIMTSQNQVRDPNFPGLEAIFGISINLNNTPEIEVPIESINEMLRYTDPHQRVFRLVDLYVDNLKKYLITEEIPVDLWLIVIPESVYLYGRPKSTIQKDDNNITVKIKAKNRDIGQNYLFFQEEMEIMNKAYHYEANFHNQFKAKILSEKIVTQILRERIFLNNEEENENTSRNMQTETEIAWNITTTMYYKLGGRPWKLHDIREGVCYIGLVYKLLDDKSNNACCAAQMFLDHGDGMVFKGNIGPWWIEEKKEFHLKKKDAKELIEKSLETYSKEFGNYPKELFIHAKTYFDDEEWEGFTEAAKNKSKIIGVRINERTVFKLFRNSDFPIPRGSLLQYDANRGFLWTKGFIPRLKTYPGFETPNPLDIQITRGDADLYVVCRDILCLSRLNYNNCTYADGVPVTLKFADSIGEILTAGKDIITGVLQFKYYI
jgi:hypothetical protein